MMGAGPRVVAVEEVMEPRMLLAYAQLPALGTMPTCALKATSILAMGRGSSLSPIQQILGQQDQALYQDGVASFLLSPGCGRLAVQSSSHGMWDTRAMNGSILLQSPFAPAGEGQRGRAQDVCVASDHAGWSSSSATYQLSNFGYIE